MPQRLALTLLPLSPPVLALRSRVQYARLLGVFFDLAFRLHQALAGGEAKRSAKARAWDKVVRGIEGYRVRNGVRDIDNALGREPKDHAARAEQRRIRERCSAHSELKLKSRALERSKVRSRHLPHVRVGRGLRFTRAGLAQWVQQNTSRSLTHASSIYLA
jgi:hypothetical protein